MLLFFSNDVDLKQTHYQKLQKTVLKFLGARIATINSCQCNPGKT